MKEVMVQIQCMHLLQRLKNTLNKLFNEFIEKLILKTDDLTQHDDIAHSQATNL